MPLPFVIAPPASVAAAAPINLQRAQKMFGNVLSGTASGKIVMSGDSTTSGIGGSKATSWPTKFAAELVRMGIPARQDSVCFADPTGEARVVVGAGWAIFGNYMIDPNGATTPTTITWAGGVKDFIVRYYDNAASSFNISIDGGAATNVVGTGAGTLKSVAVSASSAGAHTMTITRVSGDFYLYVVEAFDSSVKDIQVINFGIGGGTADTFSTGAAFGAAKMVATIGPDLNYIDLGINDYGSGAPATYKTRIQAIITQYAPTSDVILLGPTPSNGQTEATQLPYYAALKDLAATNTLQFLNMHDRYVNYVAANALGLMSDSLHPNAILYADKGRYLARQLVAG